MHLRSRPIRTRAFRRTAALALVVPALMLGACTSGSGPEATPTTGGGVESSSTVPGESTLTTPTTTPTTTSAPSTDAVTVPTSVPADPTSGDLSAILPTTEEIGPGFTAVEPSPAPAEGGGILNEESLALCPALAELLLTAESDTSADAQAQFVDVVSTRTFQVQIGVENEYPGPAEAQVAYDSLITAVESCPIVNAEVPGVGMYTIFPSAARVDGLGEASMHVALDGFLTNEALATELNYSIYFWDRGGVSAAVVAVSGIDEQRQAVLIDAAQVDRVVAGLDGRIAELVS